LIEEAAIRAANIEKVTDAKPVASSNPPRNSLFPGAFFNNIGHFETFDESVGLPQTGHSESLAWGASHPNR
jgi:hypothetical protein